LATLSEKERRALVLRDLEELPTEEVARILGSSPTTVRSQISMARVKIRAFRAKLLKSGLKAQGKR
jgi:RNA polymerase sigma-70 factor (ECF subfamily)